MGRGRLLIHTPNCKRKKITKPQEACEVARKTCTWVSCVLSSGWRRAWLRGGWRDLGALGGRGRSMMTRTFRAMTQEEGEEAACGQTSEQVQRFEGPEIEGRRGHGSRVTSGSLQPHSCF